MKKNTQKTRQVSAGIHRKRRRKQGLGKPLFLWVSEEEKARLEQAAALAGVSVSRFVMERALKAAKKVISQTNPQPPKHLNLPPLQRPSKTTR